MCGVHFRMCNRSTMRCQISHTSSHSIFLYSETVRLAHTIRTAGRLPFETRMHQLEIEFAASISNRLRTAIPTRQLRNPQCHL